MWVSLKVDEHSDFVEFRYSGAGINFFCFIFTHYLRPAQLMAHPHHSHQRQGPADIHTNLSFSLIRILRQLEHKKIYRPRAETQNLPQIEKLLFAPPHLHAIGPA